MYNDFQKDMGDVKEKVRKFVLDVFLFGFEDGFEDDSSFQNDGIIDSTGILELVEFLESEFLIRVKDNELIPENIDSVNNVTAFVSRKLAN